MHNNIRKRFMKKGMQNTVQNTTAVAAVNSIEAKKRRLDSIAWLIQGDDKCGAAYFDGQTLLLATNKQEKSVIVQSTIDYLCCVAILSEEFQSITK